ncbi:MAG: hypothetical protein COV47_06070 [Candidatus Diapherotrites archaeon CG11_big_fil_rev_8_21_14_0_20_37_9]|nr:MAG: hypothetical protein COV47_06070 [Candidatus Diapherotrites archaeon CG11_big_fil_rev_8_21_14_0_20_37_9]
MPRISVKREGYSKKFIIVTKEGSVTPRRSGDLKSPSAVSRSLKKRLPPVRAKQAIKLSREKFKEYDALAKKTGKSAEESAKMQRLEALLLREIGFSKGSKMPNFTILPNGDIQYIRKGNQHVFPQRTGDIKNINELKGLLYTDPNVKSLVGAVIGDVTGSGLRVDSNATLDNAKAQFEIIQHMHAERKTALWEAIKRGTIMKSYEEHGLG